MQQNQSNLTALEKLQSVISTLKSQVNSSDYKPGSDGNKDRSSISTYPLGMQMLVQVDDYIMKQHTRKDGSISSYNVTISDISLVPKTKNEIDNWYKNDGADFVAGVFDGSSTEYKEMVQAIKDKKN